MRSLLLFSCFVCVAFSVRANLVAPLEARAVEHKVDLVTPAPDCPSSQHWDFIPEGEAEAAVPEDVAALFPQTRLDFCLDGWQSFRGNCYVLVNSAETWNNAENYCAGFEASLASVHSVWEYRFLQRLAQTGGHSLAWMGGYFFQGVWRWEDGSLFDYNKWESEASTESYQCLQLNSEGIKGWSNHGCDMRFPFICELRSNC